MDKKLLKTREDFIEWKNYCKNVAYDYVYFMAEEEDEPKEYPCVMVYHDEQCCEGSYRYDLYYHFVYLSDFNLNISTNKEVYQIRLWCSEDNCEEFWFDKELSGIFFNKEDAEKELAKYEGMSIREIEKVCEVVSVRGNRPRIVAL